MVERFELVACSSCRRHVRVVEPRCPFCRAARAPRAEHAHDVVARRSRAAIVFATSLAGAGLATLGCPGEKAVSEPKNTAEVAPPVASYGGPASPSAWCPPEASATASAAPPLEPSATSAPKPQEPPPNAPPPQKPKPQVPPEPTMAPLYGAPPMPTPEKKP